MKKIISLLLSIILVFSLSCITVFADKPADYFDIDMKIEFDRQALEYNRSLEFRINYPQGNGSLDTFINNVYYENIYIDVVSIYDTSSILDFSYFFDSNMSYYEGYFIPKGFGETEIVVTFAAFGYNEAGEELRIPGTDWVFTCTTETITVEEIEIESGYFESSEEFTFDTSSYYEQLYQGNISQDVSSGTTAPKEKGNIGIIIFIVLLVICLFVGAFVVYRNYNIKKYKKRR